MIKQKIEQLKQEAELAELNLIKNLKNSKPIKLANKVQNVISSDHLKPSNNSLTTLSLLSSVFQLVSMEKKSVPKVLIIAAKIISAFLK